MKAAGTTAWPTPSVDSILAYIMTKLQRTPTHSRRGKAVPDIQSAYIPIVSELVSQAPHELVISLTGNRKGGGVLNSNDMNLLSLSMNT